MRGSLLFIALAGVLATGCGVTPLTFEEKFAQTGVQRSDIRDYEGHMKLMVALQYANAARRATLQPGLEIPANTDRSFQVPFAIWDFSNGNNFGSAMGFLDWFNSGMNGGNHSAYYFDREVGFMSNANLHYYTFVEGDKKPSAEAMRGVWDETHKLFQDTFNKEGKCYVWGYSEKNQYALTYPKNVPGLYTEVLYKCPHPLVEDYVQKVFVSAWSNPFQGTEIIGALQSQCFWKPERRTQFADNRDCGKKQADRMLAKLGGLPEGWMQITSTPSEDPNRLEIHSLYMGETRVLPAPEATDAYVEFLSERPYDPN